jgi:predicted Rossmann-fold nucleotide-binding protein
MNERLRLTSTGLGEMLAKEGYGVVTGGWPGVDEMVARSFAKLLTSHGGSLENYLTQVVVETEMPAFPAGNLILVRRGTEEYTESVKRADAIILIGGIGGTYKTAEYGLQYGKAVLPLADTGGDAAKFYMHMLRNWRDDYFERIDRRIFQSLAREVPDALKELAAVLKLVKRS